MVRLEGSNKNLDVPWGYLRGTSLASFRIMDRDAETDRLRHDLTHYRAELNVATDARVAKVLAEYIRAIETRLRALEGKSRSHVWMLSEPDIWRAAQRMIIDHGANAPEVAAQHADALLKENHLDGAVTWRRILHAIQELQRSKPNIGERVN
jgi:hypothetical protein